MKKFFELFYKLKNYFYISSSLAISGFISIFRETILIYHFGTGDVIEAFMIAYIIPFWIINVITSTFSSVFIPVFSNIQVSQSKEKLAEFFTKIFLLKTIFLLTICIIMYLGFNFISCLFIDSNVRNLILIKELFLYLIPFIFFSGLRTILLDTLNIYHNFKITSYVPIIVNIFLLFFLYLFIEKINIIILIFITVLSPFFDFCIFYIYIRKKNIFASLLCSLKYKLPSKLVKNFGFVFFSVFINSLYFLFDQSIASRLDIGNLATLNYGIKLCSFFLTIISTVIGIIIFPLFSKIISHNNIKKLFQETEKYLKILFLLSICAIVFFIIFGEFFIKLLFERGAFTHQNTLEVSFVQNIYILQAPFFACGILLTRLFAALQKYKIILVTAFLNVGVKIISGYYFYLHLKVYGIVLSTVFVYMISFIFCFIVYILIKKKYIRSAV